MKIKIQLIALLLFALPSINAQVLFEEDFDSYPAGDLISDQTSTIPDQGGWYCGSTNPATTNIIVTPESGKGNVLIVTPIGQQSGAMVFRQAQGVIDLLWNNRTAGNNIMKFEYEFYGASTGGFMQGGGVQSQATNLIGTGFVSTSVNERINATYFQTTSVISMNFKSSNNSVPLDTWTKVEMFIDYNTNDVYFYFPSLNILESRSFSHNRIPESINFSANLNQSAVVKLDNIKLSALQTLPSHLVSVSEFVASKFNVFPNPVTDMVIITNNESIGIERIEVFDISGKTIKSLSFNNENEVQLHLGDFAAGMYLLHIKTNEGVAVKKVIKK